MILPADETALFGYYIALLNKYNCIDFNLLCIEVVKAMRGSILPTLNITHLLVDESQDTDEVQLDGCSKSRTKRRYCFSRWR